MSRCVRTARSLVRLFVWTAFTTTILFGFSDPVSAKGPQSATISGPGIDRPIELLDTSDIDLVVKLMEQTGLWYDTGDPLPFGEPKGELGHSYTLTWINSGPPAKSTADRTIRQLIYLDAEGGPVLHTPAQDNLQGWGPGVIGWFAAPPGLRDTLTELGVPISSPPSYDEAAPSEISADNALTERESTQALWYLGAMIFVFSVILAGAFGIYMIPRFL